MEEFYEVYYLLVQDKNFPGIQVVEKVDFETQENAAEVNFNYKKVMEYEDDPNVEVLGFYHTHPCGHTRMSLTDVETMKAWVACFGRSLLCLIGTEMRTGGEIGGSIKYPVVNGWRCFKQRAFSVNILGFNSFEDQYQIRIDRYPKLEDSRYLIEG